MFLHSNSKNVIELKLGIELQAFGHLVLCVNNSHCEFDELDVIVQYS